MRDWYNKPEPKPKAQEETVKLKWADILKRWNMIVLDLHETFGIDTESGVLEHRTWWWLHDRILDLINKPSRLRSSLEITSFAST